MLWYYILTKTVVRPHVIRKESFYNPSVHKCDCTNKIISKGFSYSDAESGRTNNETKKIKCMFCGRIYNIYFTNYNLENTLKED